MRDLIKLRDMGEVALDMNQREGLIELCDMSEVALDDKVVFLNQPKSDETHRSNKENRVNFVK